MIGVPSVNDNDAELIVEAIFAMRGVNQKKHKALHEEVVLKLLPRPMAYKGTAHAWLRNIGQLDENENWTEAPKDPDPIPEDQQILEEIKCLECEGTQSTKEHKLFSRNGLSQNKCKPCPEVSIAMKWNCMGGIKWHKCRMHLRRNLI